MANYAGSLLPAPEVDRTYHLTGVRFTITGFPVMDVFGAGSLAGGTSVPYITGSPINVTGRLGLEHTLGYDWFERVHILPRSAIDFGNIVTDVDQSYEIFSAYRSTTTILTAFANNAGDGIIVPDLPALGSSLAPLTSFLDPSSARLVPVRPVITALRNGLPSFDGTLVFTFGPGGDVSVRVLGARISLLTVEPDSGVVETLESLTQVQVAVSGKEQRSGLRACPRQYFDLPMQLSGRDRRLAEALILGKHDRAFGVPLWHERMLVSATVSSGATTFSVRSTVDADLRDDGYVVLFTSDQSYDVLAVLSHTTTSITTKSGTTRSYPVGTYVMPVRIAQLEPAVSHRRNPKGPTEVRARFRCLDNSTGALVGDVSGWSSYAGRVLLTANFMLDGDVEGSYSREMFVIDCETGTVIQNSNWVRDKSTAKFGFLATTRAQVTKLRKLLLALDGRRVSFWTRNEQTDDLLATADLSSGSSVLRIENIGFSRNVVPLNPRSTFLITFTDGSSLVRTITSASEVDASNEDLQLNTTWPANRLVSEISSIQWLQLCRLDTDKVTIIHRDIGRAECTVPTITTFDD